MSLQTFTCSEVVCVVPRGTGKPLAFNWLGLSVASQSEAEEEEEEEEEEVVDYEADFEADPYGISRQQAEWTWKSGKPVLMDPGAVVKDDFVIMRAASDVQDASCFKITGIEVPLLLCKVSNKFSAECQRFPT